MKKIALLVILTWISGLIMNAQHRTCASHDINNMLLQTNPEYAAKRVAIEEHTQRYIANPVKLRGVKTIPVVVHVIYENANENISDAQILSQIDVLNKDFRKLNADTSNTPAAFKSLAADCEFQFCLAQIDPNGNPTTGIVRVPTTVTTFTGNDAVKFNAQGGDNAWDRNKYLNIWVCDIMGTIGYASFPGSPAELDGVVVNYMTFGVGGSSFQPYHLGRTATHEVGHWMNLYHIWGDDGTGCLGSDRVDDTPNQAGYNSGCATFPKISCNNGPNGDMFMNFMDYSVDNCLNLFTEGQKARMTALFAPGGARWSLLSSNGCNNNNCGMADSLFATNINFSSATIGWKPVANAVNYMLQFKLATDTAWTTTYQTGATIQFNNLNALSTYEFRVLTQCNTGNSIFTNPYSFTTTAVPLPCNNPDSLYAIVSSHSTATIGWRNAQYATGYNLRYKAFTNVNWIEASVQGNNLSLTDLLPTSTYEFQVQTICANGLSIWSNLFAFVTPAIPVACSNSFEPSNNNRNASCPTIALNTTIGSMITSANDRDFYRVITTNEEPKLKVSLTNLPGDYDVRLLSSSGTQLTISQNAGTMSEELWHNANVGGTYFIHIYSAKSNQFSTTDCYHLTTSTNVNNWRIDEHYPATGKDNKSDDDRLIITEDLKVVYDALANEPVNINVYSIQGQLINSYPVIATNDGKNTTFLPEMRLSAGIYIIEVKTAENRQVEKFIIR